MTLDLVPPPSKFQTLFPHTIINIIIQDLSQVVVSRNKNEFIGFTEFFYKCLNFQVQQNFAKIQKKINYLIIKDSYFFFLFIAKT